MIILDVRTKEEFEKQHIQGAILFDIMDIMQGISPPYTKDTELLLYCESGNRAMMAKSLLENEGFSHVVNGGGIEDMSRNNFKVINI